MKIIFSILCCLLFTSCSKEKLPPEMQQSLNRTTNYIEQYKIVHSNFPAKQEFMNWMATNNLVGVIDYQPTNGEYLIYVWRGERLVIYSSSNKKIHEPEN
jgi:hypothetical protein